MCNVLPRLCRFVLLFLTVLPCTIVADLAGQSRVAWALVAPAGQSSPFTPFSGYQYSPSGASITVTRSSVSHRFTVTIPDVSAAAGGCVHATPFGGNHTAVVEGWSSGNGNVSITIALFDVDGNPAPDTAFTVHWRDDGPVSRRDGYVWAHLPTASSYTASSTYAWNGNRGAPTIQRNGTGAYEVVFPGLGPSGAKKGQVQVSPYGFTPTRAKVSSWANYGGDLHVFVRTVDMTGGPVDARFTCSYNESAGPIHPAFGSGAHVWANEPTTDYYAPHASYTDGNGHEGPADNETVTRLGTGTYRVSLPSMAPSSSSTVQVTAQGTSAEFAAIQSWLGDGKGGTNVTVRTYDASGVPADARFCLKYLTSRPGARPEMAWAWVNTVGLAPGQSYTPSLSYQHTNSGQPITVTRHPTSTNVYEIALPGIAGVHGENVQITPHNGDHLMFVGHIIAGLVPKMYVHMYDRLGNPTSGKAFTVLYMSPTIDQRRGFAYVRAVGPHPTRLDEDHTWNGNRGAPSLDVLGVGSYRITFPGLAPSGPEKGTALATAAFAPVRRAKIVTWNANGNDLEVYVAMTDPGGVPTDGNVYVYYQETATAMLPQHGSGAHVWGNHPTFVTYTPHPEFTHSNGDVGPAGSETIDRVGTGRYRVNLPNMKPSGSSIAVATGFGADGTYATIDYWTAGASTGTRVYVETWDLAGNPTDARFTLLYQTTDPITTAATNTSLGTGCHGVALTAPTRPLLGRDWNLALRSVPGGALLGFVQVDLVGTTYPLGVNAPGCTAYTGGAVSQLVLLPAANPAYSLAIPNDPGFVGLSVYAQGGALVPNLNPYSVAVSNGMRGDVGDF
ncbi:MAG: hypothetical protein NXI31_00690 [bacterium]|nr:hypothetical protein [bacterium]